MGSELYVRLAIIFGLVKGAVLALATSALDITFWKALVIAAVSASIGAVGVMLAAYIAVRESRRNRSILQDVKQKIGASQRANDERNGG